MLPCQEPKSKAKAFSKDRLNPKTGFRAQGLGLPCRESKVKCSRPTSSEASGFRDQGFRGLGLG